MWIGAWQINMVKAEELIYRIYTEIKEHYPDFQVKKYDTSRTIYFEQNSWKFPGKNGIGFKFYEEFGRFKVGVKSNLKTGHFDDNVFWMPEQYELAREAIFNLYEIKSGAENYLDIIIGSFEKELIKHNLNLFKKKIGDGNYFFLSPNENNAGMAVARISKRVEKPSTTLVVKRFAPLDCEKNNDDFTYEYDVYRERIRDFKEPIEMILLIISTLKFYNDLILTSEFHQIQDLNAEYNIDVKDTKCENNRYSVLLPGGAEITINKGSAARSIVARNRITGEIREYDFTENGIYEAYSFLLERKVRLKAKPKNTIIINENKIKIKIGGAHPIDYFSNGDVVWSVENPQIASINNGILTGLREGKTKVFAHNGDADDTCVVTVEKKEEYQSFSDEAKKFIESVSALKSDVSDEELEILCNTYDELPEEDCSNKTVEEARQLLNILSAKNEEIVSQSVRFVYASKTFLKDIEDIDESLKEQLNNIKKNFNTLKQKELNDFLCSKRLVHIDGYLKIRVKNTEKDRVVFCYGNKFGKNAKDIYVFSYNKTHDFKNIKYLRPEEQKYSLWAIEKPKVIVPPLTKKQETISNSVDKPLICTGCAGSGKTLISVYMYIYLLDKDFGGTETTAPENLVYITYNENAKENAANQIKEIVSTANCKTIYEFFYDIAKPDLQDLKFADETHFTWWWNNKISDHLFKSKINSISQSNPIKYVYTFYRGLFKGSTYRWKKTYDDVCLTKEEMKDLLSKESIESEKIDLIYNICEMYQKYLFDNKMFDDNDLARYAAKRLTKGLSKKYLHIILDEVQDLTEVQLDAVVKASNDKRKLYFFGDQNQSINPTLFNLDFIEMCLIKNDSYIEPQDIHRLRNSYRFGPHLAKYINKLVKLKQKWIGTLSLEETEGSNKDIEKNRWAGKAENADVIKSILLKASNSANAIIIVPDIKVKNELKDMYGDEFAKRVTTIYDSKGLEWDYVVLYNMLKFNEDKYLEMINGKGKYSTLHRMIFNQYYVGCTRAVSCFSVLETNLNTKIKDEIIGELQTISQTNLSLYIQEENDAASWYNEGVRLFDAGIYDLSYAAFEKAEVTIEEEPRMEIASLLLDPSAKSDLTLAKMCREKHFYKEAAAVYQNAKNNNMAKLMNIYNGITVSEDDVWEIIKNEVLNSDDMNIIEKRGYLNSKNDSIIKKIKILNNILRSR